MRHPGDGVCLSAPDDPVIEPSCTFIAALDEANALGAADIHVDRAGLGPFDGRSITGDIAIDGSGVDSSDAWGFAVTVAVGGKLTLTDIGDTTMRSSARITVAGSLVLNRTALRGDDDAAVVVQAGGKALLLDSWLDGLHSARAIQSAGSVVAVRSSFAAFGGPAHSSTGGGTSRWMSTVASTFLSAGCDGTKPTSLGYDRARAQADCGLTATGDGAYSPPSGYLPFPDATSPLVDAVPLGVAGCSPDVKDLYGAPRGNDGNGDGVPGCDIGAIEYTPQGPPTSRDVVEVGVLLRAVARRTAGPAAITPGTSSGPMAQHVPMVTGTVG